MATAGSDPRKPKSPHWLNAELTYKCPLHCVFCYNPVDYATYGRELTTEEWVRVLQQGRELGLVQLGLSGGEPLLRRHLERLIEKLAVLVTPEGKPLDLTLTTNGSLLARRARSLRNAGLRRVTISLDALDEAIFQRMNDADFPVASVLAGIEAAEAAGLAPLKINMVVQRGVNDGEIVPMARHFRGSRHIVRFIEFMDVGASNGWRLDDVLPSAEVVRRIDAVHPLQSLEPNYPGEVAERWAYRDGQGEIGVISSVTQPFCGSCSRARLSTEGRLYTCLFATEGHDLRALLRGSFTDPQIAAAIGQIWRERHDRYSELRSAETTGLRRIEMSYIGG